MSNTIMLTQSTAKPTKARTSISLDLEKKQAIQEIAKRQNRTPHYVMIEMLTKGIQEAQEEAEYQEYVKNRVLKALHRFETEGSNGVPSEQVFDAVMQRIEAKKQLKK